MHNKKYTNSFANLTCWISELCLIFCSFACTTELEDEDEDKYNHPYYDHFLPIYNYCGNTENVHPKVLYFPDSLFDYTYWMAYSPYPQGNPKYENPCIAFSNDGINWQNIIDNPLDIPLITYKQYNSDPHLLYNPETKKLELWFRYADELSLEEVIFRMTSSDGQNWTSREELLHNSGNRNCALYLSPAAYFDEGKYHIWTVCTKPYTINYYESVDGNDWQYIRSINLEYQYNNQTFHPWHIDVIHCDGLYRMTIMVKEDTPGNTWCLFYSESEDNEHWSTPVIMLLPKTGHWDEQLYRSCLVKTDYGYNLYYSARNGTTYGIGLYQASSPLLFIKERP